MNYSFNQFYPCGLYWTEAWFFFGRVRKARTLWLRYVWEKRYHMFNCRSLIWLSKYLLLHTIDKIEFQQNLITLPVIIFIKEGAWWSWSYANWIYNYLCNQSPSPLMLWVRMNPAHGEEYSIQHYVIKFVSDLQQVCGFLRVLRFPPSIKLTATIRYNWSIVESGVKHHMSNPSCS